jgi:hypothetical protein
VTASRCACIVRAAVRVWGTACGWRDGSLTMPLVQDATNVEAQRADEAAVERCLQHHAPSPGDHPRPPLHRQGGLSLWRPTAHRAPRTALSIHCPLRALAPLRPRSAPSLPHPVVESPRSIVGVCPPDVYSRALPVPRAGERLTACCGCLAGRAGQLPCKYEARQAGLGTGDVAERAGYPHRPRFLLRAPWLSAARCPVPCSCHIRAVFLRGGV